MASAAIMTLCFFESSSFFLSFFLCFFFLGAVSAWGAGDSVSDDAACDGGCFGWWEDGGESWDRGDASQEHGGGVSSAFVGASGCGCAGDAAGSGVSVWARCVCEACDAERGLG
eukprot:TRINITY_DN59023_c0_g1_i1.p2 TRINITY_DN59023_c0_g1~~TRINITY_DN59023_c0_g1_i1.p2  ORF type:complete len:114 (+),score=17.07 TRINITY_DN59023_c0_g1_i1:48-389(+)